MVNEIRFGLDLMRFACAFSAKARDRTSRVTGNGRYINSVFYDISLSLYFCSFISAQSESPKRYRNLYHCVSCHHGGPVKGPSETFLLSSGGLKGSSEAHGYLMSPGGLKGSLNSTPIMQRGVSLSDV